ncbi:MAG: phosphoglycolate phosphatase [Thermoplasmata archaeon]
MIIKAIATDIDGTLTNKRREIPLATISALRKAEKKGIKVMLVSGNTLPVALGIKIMIGLSGPVIGENGGILFYNNSIYKYFDKEDIEIEFERFKKLNPDVKRIYTDRWRETSIAVVPEYDVRKVRDYFVPLGFRVEYTGYGIHIAHSEQNKYFGVRKASEILGLDCSEILAIGDSENDVEMVKNCGFGVAVNNAIDELKGVSKYVSRKNYGYGVVESLKYLGII